MSVSDLLARILANPGERDARLVYADAIAETDPARGELIVVELRLGEATGEERIALLQRRAALLDAKGGRWWGEVSERQLVTAGGFVEAARLETDMDARLFGQLALREPITKVVALGGDGPPPASALVRVRELELQGPMEAATIMAWLRAVPQALDTLAIRTVFTSSAATVRQLPAARRLLLDGSTTDLGPLLDEFHHWGELEELGLAHTTLTDDELLGVTRRDLRRLRRLYLGGNDLRVRGLHALAAAVPRMPALEQIDVVDARVVNDATAALAALVDAARPRVTVVRSVPAPPVVAFELFNRSFEIRADEDRHRVAIDGALVQFIYREIRANLGQSSETKVYQERAPLHGLARALACGVPIRWSGDLHNPAKPIIRPTRGVVFTIRYDHGQLEISKRQ